MVISFSVCPFICPDTLSHAFFSKTSHGIHSKFSHDRSIYATSKCAYLIFSPFWYSAWLKGSHHWFFFWTFFSGTTQSSLKFLHDWYFLLDVCAIDYQGSLISSMANRQFFYLDFFSPHTFSPEPVGASWTTQNFYTILSTLSRCMLLISNDGEIGEK